MNKTEIKKYLSVIKRATSYIEAMLENDDGLLEEMIEQPVASIPKSFEPNPEEIYTIARKKHVQDLLSIDCWPEAVPPFQMKRELPEKDQIHRANAVLDMMIGDSLEGVNFLDFGCGDGWITQAVLQRGVSEATGYDIEKKENWTRLIGTQMTHQFNMLKPKHYDVVMLYDVLDHAKDSVQVMEQVRHVLKPSGTVYVCCHPWTAKHATHLNKQGVNKAYLHLFLKWEEIAELIKECPIFTRAEKSPIVAYHWWFKDFDIKKERFIKESVSEFFHVPAFKELLASEQQIPLSEIDDFLKLMEIQFVYYQISLKGQI